MGNVKFYSDFTDETLNLALRTVVQHSHRLTMEGKVFTMFNLQGSLLQGYIFGDESFGTFKPELAPRGGGGGEGSEEDHEGQRLPLARDARSFRGALAAGSTRP